MDFDYEQYQRDLAEALRSEDKEIILTFFAKHEVPTPSNELSLWTAVHKMRLALPAFTEQEKEASRTWLRNRGMQPKPSITPNLQRHLAVFSAELAEAQASGMTEEEAGRAAAEEANRLHPLTDEDKEVLRTAGRARGII